MDKSYVSIEEKICPVCGQKHTYHCGILLDRRLKNSMEKETITGYDLCEEHSNLAKDGYIFLVEIDPKRSEVTDRGTILPDKAYRTGVVISVKESVCEQVGLPKKSYENQIFVFIDHEMVEFFERLRRNNEI